ncbi:MAG: hypothetical protein FDZ70_05320 [Actinobacteria bacterium]|nr:MAG: hypothetical protein FDZ70_05320 [Actinomycetota bacterium]
MRDHLTPWLVVAVAAVAFLPLVVSGGCVIACELGAMPTGACGHAAMTGADVHMSGEMLASAPPVQPSIAAVTLLVLVVALMLAGAGPGFVSAFAQTPGDARAGTRLRV